MQVAITGVSGFLGSHLAQVLKERGERTIGVARRPERASWLVCDEIVLRRADLAEPSALAAAFRGADAVIANAALAPGWAKYDDRAFIDANIAGTENTLRAAAQAGVRRVVLVSTVAVYRTRAFRPMTEDHPQVDPGRPRFELSQITTDARYARTKAAAERMAWKLAEELDLELTTVRPGPIYGPRDHKVTARYGRWLDRPLTLAPTAKVPHVHVRDVAQAIVAALCTPAAIGRAYNLGGRAVSPYRILRTWRAIRGGGGLVLPVPTPLAVRFDNALATRDLGFAPRAIDDGLRDCVAWYEARGRTGE